LDGALARSAPVREMAIVGLVLESYKTVMARSRNERDAFETAVRTYRAHSAGLSQKEARRAVADIICGKADGGYGDRNGFSDSHRTPALV
jgi:hypothetical protein